MDVRRLKKIATSVLEDTAEAFFERNAVDMRLFGVTQQVGREKCRLISVHN
jgi:hypothetical protein